jgi:glycerate 2-kinase
MRILVAPDSFKGSLSAEAAAEAIARGVRRAMPDALVDLCPLADGGEGTAAVLVAALGGTFHERTVCGPLGAPVTARWAMLGDGATAVIESAEAAGLLLVPEGRRDPTRTTTFGVGELVREALREGATRVWVTLGGTATTDGGTGLAQALGVRFDGMTLPASGGQLAAIRSIDVTGRLPALASAELVALADVDNPLTGETGAARVFAPQKGASPAQVAELDAALRHLAAVAGDPGTTPGDGAAGGLGYGLRVLAGARRRRGIDVVRGAVRFDERLRSADLVLTGEGRLDGQSARGKVVGGVCEQCRSLGVPAIALVGSVGPGAELLLERGLVAFHALVDDRILEAEARVRAAELLESLAARVLAGAPPWAGLSRTGRTPD